MTDFDLRGDENGEKGSACASRIPPAQNQQPHGSALTWFSGTEDMFWRVYIRFSATRSSPVVCIHDMSSLITPIWPSTFLLVKWLDSVTMNADAAWMHRSSFRLRTNSHVLSQET